MLKARATGPPLRVSFGRLVELQAMAGPHFLVNRMAQLFDLSALEVNAIVAIGIN
jgi:hypothetical protein